MHARISQGPYAALGIAETTTADEVRTAFLALTKQFHPARFGRLAIDVQRLANEVFLGIKGAHDQLMKQLGNGRRSAMQSGGMPVITDAKVSGAIPVVRIGTPSPARPGTPPLVRGTDRPPERQSTPVVARTSTPSQPIVSRTATPVQPARTGTPALGTPIARPTTPSMRPTTPTGTRPPTPPVRPPSASSALNPDTVRGVAPAREPAFDERAALREALMQLNEQS
ncbi:MAG TPA: J domain-containing protein, partial [Kofleriaceae bacterium]|nr:J domain-containing protein [Kofleriaceae bacterium]